MVRVSFIVYDVKQPIVSTYMQIKVFRTNNSAFDLEKRMTLDAYVNLTLQELRELSKKEAHLTQIVDEQKAY